MKILAYLLAMMATCGVAGALWMFCLQCKRDLFKFCLPIGYAYTLVAFYILYMVLGSADEACFLTLLLPIICGAVALVVRKKSHKSNHESLLQLKQFISFIKSLDFRYLLSVSLLVLIISAWPYFLSGFGNYWHSGNYDMEDGLNGRDAYLNNAILESKGFDLGEIIGDKSWHEFSKVAGVRPKKAHNADSYRAWYAGDGFRFQYSSLAFWSVLLNLRHGLDVFVIQAIMNLIFMAIGIYYLCQIVFCMAPLVSALAAGASVTSSFYLTTYFSGHQGSLMYGALIPALLSLSMNGCWINEKNLTRVLLAGLIIMTIAFTYPHPLIILAFPVVLYHLLSHKNVCEKINKVPWAAKNHPYITGFLLILLLGFLAILINLSWEGTAAYRIRQESQYRAWGFTRDPIILPLFLGLIGSPVEGSVFVGALLGRSAYWGLAILSGLFILFLAICFWNAKTKLNSQFLRIFGVLWILGYVFFLFFIKDSYYLYKYMYVHQFLFIIGIIAFVFQLRYIWIKLAAGALMLANLKCDLRIAQNVHHRPYNQSQEKYKQFLQLNHDLLKKSFIQLTGGDAIAARQTLKANGIHTELDPRIAEYFILPKDREADITGEQFKEFIMTSQNHSFAKAPSANYLMIRTWNEPEYFPGDPTVGNSVFRWVGHGKNDNLGIFVIRPKDAIGMQGKFLRVCFQAGPSSPNTIPITISTAANEILCRFDLSGSGVRSVWIPAELIMAGQSQPLLVRSGGMGKSLLPLDDRILLYRVFSVEWTDTEYDEKALAYFNQNGDIVINPIQTTQGHTEIKLGQGWETLETVAGQRFRWAGDKTDLVLIGKNKNETVDISMDLEPGPSLGQKKLVLEVLDSEGKKILETPPISERGKIRFSVACQKNRNTIISLRANSENLPVPNDLRTLNYRVFQISLKQKNKNPL